ncbi:EP1-like glycoprotein 4 [Vitis riparia]|uniref:EP1-like glycoprotein 4 n=1 Tax=Vitis riparia TaxID=96939 RepID=UPI00155A89CB|nr:EP1-like glycoprotein 4 [Vitis riparia]
MGIKWVWGCFLPCLTLLVRAFHLVNGQDVYYPVANLSSSWPNNPSPHHYVDSDDRTVIMPILLRKTSTDASFVCGFYCNYDCNYYLFAVLMFPNSANQTIRFPKVVWSANRNIPVQANGTVQLTQGGDLILREVDGTVVWSTNTSGKSVVGLNLTETGNLVLFDSNDASVWQSFDHPTDSLVPEQNLLFGQKLS